MKNDFIEAKVQEERLILYLFFGTYRTIYERFAKDNSNAEQEALCYSAIDDIDPNIRFCAYRLQLNDDIENIASSHYSGALDAQLASIGHKKEAGAAKTMTWRDKEFTIKNQALVQAVEKAQESKDWTEAEKLTKKALKEDKEATAKITSSKSAKATEDLNNLFTYVEYSLFGSVIERNLALIGQAEKPQQAIKLYDEILQVRKWNREYE